MLNVTISFIELLLKVPDPSIDPVSTVLLKIGTDAKELLVI